MKFTITLEFKASNEEKAMQTAEVLQRLLQDVPEEKIGELHKLLRERPKVITELLDKLNSPLIQKLFG